MTPCLHCCKQVAYKKRSTLKGKNLLPNFVSFKVDPFSEGDNSFRQSYRPERISILFNGIS